MTLENWHSVGKLKKHQTSEQEISDIFNLIERDLQDASLEGLSADRKFNITYNAAFQAGLALLYCYGYKPATESNHYITWIALRDILGKEQLRATDYFDRCRKKRNIADYYRAGVVSNKEAEELLKETKAFVEFVRGKIKTEFPEYL
jgi:uncharacterized protein (UPF0332 family)